MSKRKDDELDEYVRQRRKTRALIEALVEDKGHALVRYKGDAELIARSTYPGVVWQVTHFTTEDGEVIATGHSEATTVREAVDVVFSNLGSQHLIITDKSCR